MRAGNHPGNRFSGTFGNQLREPRHSEAGTATGTAGNHSHGKSGPVPPPIGGTGPKPHLFGRHERRRRE